MATIAIYFKISKMLMAMASLLLMHWEITKRIYIKVMNCASFKKMDHFSW